MNENARGAQSKAALHARRFSFSEATADCIQGAEPLSAQSSNNLFISAHSSTTPSWYGKLVPLVRLRGDISRVVLGRSSRRVPAAGKETQAVSEQEVKRLPSKVTTKDEPLWNSSQQRMSETEAEGKSPKVPTAMTMEDLIPVTSATVNLWKSVKIRPTLPPKANPTMKLITTTLSRLRGQMPIRRSGWGEQNESSLNMFMMRLLRTQIGSYSLSWILEEKLSNGWLPASIGAIVSKPTSNWMSFVWIVSSNKMVALMLACNEEEFPMCDSDCPQAKGFFGITSRNCYPSSPVYPRFAISFEVFELFHGIHMKGSSSKQVYCDSLMSLLRKFGFVYQNETTSLTLQNPPNMYKNFLWAYFAFLEIESVARTKVDQQLWSRCETQNGSEQTPDLWENNPTDALKDPIPLSSLCTACFGSNPPAEFAVVSFDACMQQKSFGRTQFNPADEFKDKRLFVNSQLYEMENLDDVEVTADRASWLMIRPALQHVHLISKRLPIHKAWIKCLILDWSQHVAVMTFHYDYTIFGGLVNEWRTLSAVFWVSYETLPVRRWCM